MLNVVSSGSMLANVTPVRLGGSSSNRASCFPLQLVIASAANKTTLRIAALHRFVLCFTDRRRLMPTRWLRTVAVLAIIVPAVACGHRSASPSPSPPPDPQQTKVPNVVDAAAIAAAPGQPLENILADRVAGVRLGRASDGSLTVQIRGGSGDTQPLYVIDGVPITPGPGGSLSGINPYDIQWL